MNLSAIDLNLFLVLHAVLETGSATGAARQLHVTQSAVSNALARLRELLGDPLLVRQGKGLVPTPRCEELRPLLVNAVAQLQVAVDGQRFLPEESTRRFTLACGDNQDVCDVPRVVEAFARRMPLAQLRVVSIDFLVASDGLATGEVDVALGPRLVATREGFCAEDLYLEEVAFVVRKDHPLIPGTVLTREAFNACKHIDIVITQGRPGVGRSMFERFRKENGLEYSSALAVSHFIAAGMAATRTDYIAGMPGRTAEVLCAMLPLKRLQFMPVPPPMTMSLMWHTRTDADPGSRCFRQLLLDVLKDLPPTRAEPRAKAPSSGPSRRARSR
ncbi:LysR family transcriptional regulator [Myxococcus qinghaiensis]|uniref:LysR family transcriptional regulator n=1 Tax=Myxococcus qinghaiensis TaxID=2906758 RepID=UPI0020A72A58|nr:LysR family transcriptional regulator [Myxococcus qinghaiensis]MCP3168968.1 LysR family transcriptional regulator [Myxococcus qinghaiensis]